MQGNRLPPFVMLLASLCATLGGCCGPQTEKPIIAPPPISLEEQVSRLTRWAGSFPRLQAKTVDRGVTIKSRDENGQAHTDYVEGALLIRRPADILLVGLALSKRAFDAGSNADVWWFADRYQTHTAWIGDARAPVEFSRLRSASSEMRLSALRADLVLDLLALSDLPDLHKPPAAQRGRLLTMRVNDVAATNDLWIEQLPTTPAPAAAALPGAARLVREIIVDRLTDEIREVRLYDDAGVLAVQSILTHYAPVTLGEEGEASAAKGPRFPYRITINYMVEHLSISLEFATVSVPTEPFSDAAFQPNIEGLKVIRVE